MLVCLLSCLVVLSCRVVGVGCVVLSCFVVSNFSWLVGCWLVVGVGCVVVFCGWWLVLVVSCCRVWLVVSVVVSVVLSVVVSVVFLVVVR